MIYEFIHWEKTLRQMGLKWLVFLIGLQDLIGVWFSDERRANIIKTRV